MFGNYKIEIKHGCTEYYKSYPKFKNINLTEEGIRKVERKLNVSNLYDIENSELTHFIENALKAQFIFKKDQEYVVKNHKELENKVYDVPIKLDNKVAEIKLRSMNVKIDKLTAEQNTYLNSWESGT